MGRARYIIERLGLTPHPEGGFYRETYRSAERTGPDPLLERFNGERNLCTAIYFLLPKGDKSHLHRIKSDEIWHHYAGGPLRIVELTPAGELIQTVLGSPLKEDALPQYVVKAGHWFGAYPMPGSAYSLVGCTVAPGFDFADFELATPQWLAAQSAAHRDQLAPLVAGA